MKESTTKITRPSILPALPPLPRSLPLLLMVLVLVATGAAVGYAQSGGGFDLSWFTVDAGGGRTQNAGGQYVVESTTGQPDAGTHSSADKRFAVIGGFQAAGENSPANVATSTPCPIQFQDVPSDYTFYPFVRCLACRNILGGYQCGGDGEPCGSSGNPYFRPSVQISRGQIAKIVSQSAGLNDAPGTRIFEDVPEQSPFFAYIQRLTNEGHMGGYPCGQLDTEPCELPGNRPYFRPSSNATRGQLSKIVANAAGIDDAVTGQTYEDVPGDSPFYLFIERLSDLNVMSGYPCGAPAEPCGAGNKPYFHPNANVTRGQAAKIVANTFFPNCQTPARR